MRSLLVRTVLALLGAAPLACGGGSAEVTDQDESFQKETKSVVLDIPSRNQWQNGNGYCGETSIQSIGLHYGAWISQDVARKTAGGEVLLGDNEEKTLDELNFEFDTWKSKKDEDQFEDFAVWLKEHLADRHPAIFGVYLSDGTNDPDYDHIVPAIGIEYRHRHSYDEGDVLVFHDNFGDKLRRTFGSLTSSRKKCAYASEQGGCIPKDVDYGIAVTGIVDKRKVTLPTELRVAADSEPNVSQGEKAIDMRGTVTVSSLEPGASYVLLRYDDAADVPRDKSAKDFLDGEYVKRVDFVASGTTWTYADPTPFRSDGVAYYRCVPR